MSSNALALALIDPAVGDAPLEGAEIGELARLTSVEDERDLLPLRHGPVELAVLRRRIHGRVRGALEVVDVPAFGLVVAAQDGTANFAAFGLDKLDDRALEVFRRKTLELVGVVTREQIQREVFHAH